jgi:starvation-inducible DNA-binding protein
MLGMAMSELTMGARYTALERSDAVRSDGYLTREPKARHAFHAGAGATSPGYRPSGTDTRYPRRDLGFKTVNTSWRSEEMASIATSTHLPALGEPHEREAFGGELQATLLELVDLSLIGKPLPWSVFSRLFRPLDLFLDELVDSWRELADTVAERAVALGYIPDGQAQAVAARSQLTPVAQLAPEDHAVVRELTDRIAEVSELEPHGPIRRVRRRLTGRPDRGGADTRGTAVDAQRPAWGRD